MHYPLDVESYPNYFLLCVHDKSFEIRGEDNVLSTEDIFEASVILKNNITFGFNSNHYDIPMIMYALDGATANQLNMMSQWIIKENARIWKIVDVYDLSSKFPINHIDLIEPSPGVFIGLKKYGARLHAPSLEDLPYPPEQTLNASEMDAVHRYCLNDLKLTVGLYEAVEDRIHLRERLGEKYGTELRSKSDAQIAEAVIRAELGNVKRPGRLPAGITFKYKIPSWVAFESEELTALVERLGREDFVLDGGGKVRLPSWLKPVQIGDSLFKMGIGGLHSMEKKQAIVPNENQLLIDADVASYYPNIILNEKLYPAHLGSRFLDTYRELVERRLKAKHEGDDITAGGLKITVNGAFGKLANKYSFLYSPDLMLAVTLTGQLALLMLIEAYEKAGMRVVSANTDGVVCLMDKEQRYDYDGLNATFEVTTGFELEQTEYKALYSRDVNNYLAVKDGSYKGKGVFTDTGLMKDPAASIVHEAVTQYLVNGKEIDETIWGCGDVRKFVIARNATGGANWRGQYLGKTVRWIWSVNGDPITSVKNGNKVANSDGAYAVMTLPDRVPRWIDYDKYIAEAHKLLASVGYQS